MQFSTSTFVDLPARLRGFSAPGRIMEIQSKLQSAGVDAALAVLNSGVQHRYTAIFKLDGALLQNTHMFDRQGEVKPAGLETVVLTDSFCQIVMREGHFISDKTGDDRRLDYSPYQNVVASYHGVPILNHQGELYGTLCHFDMVEQTISADEFACLQETAKLLPPYIV